MQEPRLPAASRMHTSSCWHVFCLLLQGCALGLLLGNCVSFERTVDVLCDADAEHPLLLRYRAQLGVDCAEWRVARRADRAAIADGLRRDGRRGPAKPRAARASAAPPAFDDRGRRLHAVRMERGRPPPRPRPPTTGPI